MKRTWPYIVIALAALTLVAPRAWLYLRSLDVPLLAPSGPVGMAERSVLITTFALSSIVIVPVFFLLFFFAWKYRAKSVHADVHHAPNWDHDNPAIEFAWWLIPMLIIFILAGVAWRSSHALDPYKPLPGNALTVQVVALDWKWLFLYPEQGIASVNMLEIPAGRPIHFLITADAPMNSFWIPALGGQIMAMPGMTTQLNLEAYKAGAYEGYSANISGKGFAGMAFTTHAVSQQDFDAWVAAARQQSSPLDYVTLAQPSENVASATYTLPDPKLYDSIVMKYMVPDQKLSAPVAPVAPATTTPSSGGMMEGMNM